LLISTRIGTSMCVSTMMKSRAISAARACTSVCTSVEGVEQAVSRIAAVSATLRMV
jgi:hypothetical protein